MAKDKMTAWERAQGVGGEEMRVYSRENLLSLLGDFELAADRRHSQTRRIVASASPKERIDRIDQDLQWFNGEIAKMEWYIKRKK